MYSPSSHQLTSRLMCLGEARSPMAALTESLWGVCVGCGEWDAVAAVWWCLCQWEGQGSPCRKWLWAQRVSGASVTVILCESLTPSVRMLFSVCFCTSRSLAGVKHITPMLAWPMVSLSIMTSGYCALCVIVRWTFSRCVHIFTDGYRMAG